MPSSTRQWRRAARVVVGKSGTGLSVSKLRIQFEVTKTIDETPNTALIRIFNLHPTNESKIKNEFEEVLLFGGYTGNERLIFRGNLVHVFRYRMGGDYITEIDGGDGDRDYREATMNETLAAGTTLDTIMNRAVSSFATVGKTIKGYASASSSAQIRGRVLSGNTRDVLRQVAREEGAHWSIQDGQLTIVKTNGTLPNTAIVVRADTGMLEAPKIHDKGISVKTLMNPELAVNGIVKLDNNAVRIKRQSQLPNPLGTSRKTDLVRLDPDGLYKIIQLKHSGDTHSEQWTSEFDCIGL